MEVVEATATITPIKVLLKPTVNESAPAIPDANANVTLPRPACVLNKISGIVGLTVSMST